jgi:hypothetical protein
MLPSLLTRDIQQGLKQFLVSGFEPADAFMHGLMSRFAVEESAWLKGPYVQVGLPFVTGTAGRKLFPTFETEHPGYGHQENAWERLSSQRQALATDQARLVASTAAFAGLPIREWQRSCSYACNCGMRGTLGEYVNINVNQHKSRAG